MSCTAFNNWNLPGLQSAFEAAQKAAAAVAEAAEAAARADRLGDAAALFELAARQVNFPATVASINLSSQRCCGANAAD